jgi:hypothetical protein
MRLLSGLYNVEVEQGVRQHGPGGQFNRITFRRAFAEIAICQLLTAASSFLL